MAKRIVVRAGDVFCVEVDNSYKRYFQYIVKDEEYLGGNVIRCFRTRYPLDANPDPDTIVKDEVAFYALTFIKIGIDNNAWYKIGKAKETGEEALRYVLFGDPHESIVNPNDKFDFMDVDPHEHWYVGYANRPRKDVGRLPEKWREVMEQDGVLPYLCIVDRIKYGYYRWTMTFYDEVKRKPWPWVDSYTRLSDELTKEATYYHFHGDKAMRELIVDSDGARYELTDDKPQSGPYRLFSGEFGDINWKSKEFISEEEFNAVWNQKGK